LKPEARVRARMWLLVCAAGSAASAILHHFAISALASGAPWYVHFRYFEWAAKGLGLVAAVLWAALYLRNGH
jgi:hypothetical protein